MKERRTSDGAVLVSPDNFARAESDLYFGKVVADGGFGTFMHIRELTPLDNQLVVRPNRDTLYSAGVFDLEAGPLTISLPDPAGRFMSMQLITEDHYVPAVCYGQGEHTLTRNDIGTRYVVAIVRTLVDPNDDADLNTVHRLQDAVGVRQDNAGSFEIPKWDPVSQKAVRDALVQLGATVPDSAAMFGAKNDVDPVRHLIGSAVAWGGNPEKDAFYFSVHTPNNDGATVYRLTVGEVPVDGFWSVTVYNKDGYFTPNALDAYSLNNITAQRDGGGEITIQFGGCDTASSNCLPITPEWNYLVRLYRPHEEVLNGGWTFPAAQPVS
ncbi:DUF1254 domain-containing protein [Mycobacterium montefiorense]|uniref:Carboxylesterase n=1 Tax=Mycobacterium montefiorense TaxID=154654 RepID=A0AA37PP91_9MYCO|nr:DUF1254 domain-containing protein [Mycobacterium montefiorense]GBG40678.1 hypothetical protein MmonteBS_50500 [Mycobacterium montefiorense]GKU33341.1 hypothetical protein NJB14191_06880 [Mycobacterium montefiorense]GKU41731.1 hypothetical protein NJB14192_37150 [Mycobacterium montefiorense]GKU44861.1 hypothetical protein NJB14194_14850 [Mycobacterium montefiorense]GKU52155.1 hypothetical protein NJB14195_33990 [Mycobacterium montefiorense]